MLGSIVKLKNLVHVYKLDIMTKKKKINGINRNA